MTVTVQIGNSDDRLSQQEWAELVASVERVIRRSECGIHFFAASQGSMPWQNAAWVFETHSEANLLLLRTALTALRREWRQDSVAWTEAPRTEFI